jgi:hypothetical protein
MTEPHATPRRVRVTSPRTRTPRRSARVAATLEIDEQTSAGRTYVRSLIRAQRRLAVLVCVLLAVLLGGLPALFDLVPGLQRVSLFGVPLPWLVLGLLVYPVLIVIATQYVRAAERTESDFADLVER